MKWVIEHINGKKLNEDLDQFYFDDSHLIDKVYFTDGKNQYGFNYRNGIFFINNKLFDFKIDINNSQIIPFQYKTGALSLNLNSNKIVCWNIGCKLIKDKSLQEYILSIYDDHQIYFFARSYNENREIVKIRELKLQ